MRARSSATEAVKCGAVPTNRFANLPVAKGIAKREREP
jgi:hypothetical protein